jgi:hypothetical protein
VPPVRGDGVGQRRAAGREDGGVVDEAVEKRGHLR